MKDIQSQRDNRRINIKKVGVKNISYPISVRDKANLHQNTVATVNMYVNLPHQFKGTHMSRFVEVLNHFHGSINLKSFRDILEEMKGRLQAEESHMEIEFPYFLKKGGGPGSIGINEYICRMHGSSGREEELTIEIEVPIYPPLPSQVYDSMPRSLGRWGTAKIQVRFRRFIWIEDLITSIEEITSHNLNWCEVTCKDAEEKLGVESICRDLGRQLSLFEEINWFKITVSNLAEGLNTFATMEWSE